MHYVGIDVGSTATKVAVLDGDGALARAAVEGFVRTGRPLARPDGLPPELDVYKRQSPRRPARLS